MENLTSALTMRRGSRSSLAGGLLFLLASALGALMALSRSVTLLVMAAGVFAGLFFARTWDVLLFVLLLRPVLDAEVFRSVGFLPGDTNPAAALSLAVMVLGLGYIFLHRTHFYRQPISLAFLFFIMVSSLSFLSGAYAFDLSTGLYDWLRVLSTWVLYVLMVALIRRREQIKTLANVLITSTFAPLAVGLYQIFSGTGIVAGGIYRVQGTFVWPTSYARFLVMPLILGTVLLLYAESRRRKAIYLVYVALVGAVLLATYARGSWLSLCAALLVIGLIKKRILMVVVLVVILLLLVVPSPITDRFSDLSGPANTFLDRRAAWQVALHGYSGQPVSGLLLGAGWGYLDRVGLGAIGRVGVPVHNDYIRLLVETGAIGLFSYIVVLLLMGYRALRNLRESEDSYFEALSLTFVGILTANVVISASDASVIASPVTQAYFWSYAAMAQAISALNRGQDSPSQGA